MTTRWIQGLFFLFSAVAVVFTVGFYWQMTWATDLWLWPDGRLTYIFIASILLAIATPILWLAWSKDWGAASGGAFNLLVAFSGISLFLFQLALLEDQNDLLGYAIMFAVSAIANGVILWWSRQYAMMDTRPLPRPVYVSFIVFALVLSIVSMLLLFKTPNIFPWPLQPRTSVMIGWVFAGSAVYFALPLFQSNWSNAKGQLLGFLAYDLILILPFIDHFSNVQDEHRLSLIIYTTVVVYSALLAIYYLFINEETRFNFVPEV